MATYKNNGVDFEGHGYAPGEGENLHVKVSRLERLVRWMVSEAHFAAEERVALLQIARRIKLRNDLQQARIRQRVMDTDKEWKRYDKWREDSGRGSELVKVALWSHEFTSTSGGKPTRVIGRCYLMESRDKRTVVFRDLITKATGGRRRMSETEDAFEFMKTVGPYVRHIEPWILGHRPLQGVAEAIGEDQLLVY